MECKINRIVLVFLMLIVFSVVVYLALCNLCVATANFAIQLCIIILYISIDLTTQECEPL